jgi:hypothetical protein
MLPLGKQYHKGGSPYEHNKTCHPSACVLFPRSWYREIDRKVYAVDTERVGDITDIYGVGGFGCSGRWSNGDTCVNAFVKEKIKRTMWTNIIADNSKLVWWDYIKMQEIGQSCWSNAVEKEQRSVSLDPQRFQVILGISWGFIWSELIFAEALTKLAFCNVCVCVYRK